MSQRGQERNSGAGFNPEMLVLRREALGLSQGELCGRLDISQAKLSKIEAGALEPARELVEAAASVLGRPVAFFYQQDVVYGPGVSEFYHRKRQAVGARALRQSHARINEDLISLRRLLRSAEIDTSGFDAAADLDEASPEVAARAVKAIWHVPPGPVRNLTGLIEDAGGVVLHSELHSQIDGVSRWVRGLPPVFFINKDMPGDRQRSTLAHELAHMILHRSPKAEMEREANLFAGELLMPAAEIRSALASDVSLHRLAALKPYWKVSMAALLYRASDLGLIPQRRARYLWMRLGQLGYRQREPAELDVPQEKPTLFAEILRTHREDLGFSLSELTSLLFLQTEEIRSRYLVTFEPELDGKPQFRLVR